VDFKNKPKIRDETGIGCGIGYGIGDYIYDY
jgi:hypothetical protein